MWEIRVGPTNISKEIKGQQGLSVPKEQTIYINTDHTPPAGFSKVRFHEEFHMVGFTRGRAAIAAYLELNMTEMIELEELLNETYGSGMFAYLSDNNYLRYPDPPLTK